MKQKLQDKSLFIKILSLALLLTLVNAMYYQFIMPGDKSDLILSNVLIQVVLMMIGFIAFNNQYRLLALTFISYFTFNTVYSAYISISDYIEVSELYITNDLILPLVLTVIKIIASLWICLSGYCILKEKSNWVKDEKNEKS
ncbi:MAG: hypothetical protein JEZ08_20845 [Clostridiales bacterium]|nr:hypothetical protein [Clostridiales bacterium]